MNPALVEAWRGNAVESRHRGSLAVVDADGGVLAALGDIDLPVFPRSAVKVLQALPLLESGAAARFGLTGAELALACASHNGEEPHARTAAAVLAKAGLDVTALECGTHWPLQDIATRALAAAGQVPTALHNNCSGKHAGFVCLGCQLAGDRDPRSFLAGYVKPKHPVMRAVTAALQAATGYDLRHAPAGTDGCSIPTYAVPLRHLARAFARVGTGIGLSPGHAAAARQLRQAVAGAPFMVAGSGRFDTRLMERFGERVFCKVGAEGVYCAALPQRGLGVALKIDDGAARGCEVAMATLIEAFVDHDEAEAALLRELGSVTLRNWNGISVGRLAAAPELRRALGLPD